MKEELSEENRSALVSYRINRAKETMKEAELMKKEGFYNAAVNRLYYACYYSVVALLLKNNIQAQTHSGVKTMFGMHFISTGKLPIKIGRIFATLFEKRHSSDYDDFIYCDEEMTNELYEQADLFIKEITKLIENK
ncbi:MAG: HEPN domain-containing protein [Paludibacteraceae bacterium]|nr:HEPN domain-containing protein [Paludibacteraceae bacterium]